MTNLEKKIAIDFINEQLDIINTCTQNGAGCVANNYILKGANLLLDALGYDVVLITADEIRLIKK